MSSECSSFQFDSPVGEGEVDLDMALARWPTCRTVRRSTEEAFEHMCNPIPPPEEEEEDEEEEMDEEEGMEVKKELEGRSEVRRSEAWGEWSFSFGERRGGGKMTGMDMRLKGGVGDLQDDDEPTIVSGICSGLQHKAQVLKQEIEEMRNLEHTCVKTLAMLRREQAIWHAKLDMARLNITNAKKQRDEAKLLLELHTTLQSSGIQERSVKTMQKLLLQQLPKDIQRMVGDCLNSDNGLDIPACTMCNTEFSDSVLWSSETNRRCRHTLFPCNHAVVCGGCARQLWATNQVCPLCQSMMTRKPKIFKPGRRIVQ